MCASLAEMPAAWDYRCCPRCPAILRTHPQLALHVLLVHGSDRPYPCYQCDKWFKREWHLKVHIQTHQEFKPFSCLICSKSFRTEKTLQVHLATHSPDKPFACECGYRARLLATLRAHQRRTHRPRENPAGIIG